MRRLAMRRDGIATNRRPGFCLSIEADEPGRFGKGLAFRDDRIGRKAFVRPTERDALHDDLVVGDPGMFVAYRDTRLETRPR